MGDFYVRELETALAEQQFGIHSYRLDGGTSHVAFAHIKLLENHEVRVQLSIAGYMEVGPGIDSPVFETLDDLLRAISPMYGQQRVDELMSRLSQWADTSS